MPNQLCQDCILYSWKHNYCALDGKQHKGCFNNFKPNPNKERHHAGTDTD